ncbi:anti-repressor SinI family protein [Alicyclobacillus tolerans]|uniref:anti-repressor SinI family protein n=1 Tax=Alicyclobacillus tolerans TaxID=90970 RepID=UPI001F4649AA|nr:anti-repressor SinI family protein [Alicyclobacillus tolerans]MCF8566341.1 anti-repressor SinI family protein [Alicyclobacillus tolerans]
MAAYANEDLAEWVRLMDDARTLGVTVEQVRLFLEMHRQQVQPTASSTEKSRSYG